MQNRFRTRQRADNLVCPDPLTDLVLQDIDGDGRDEISLVTTAPDLVRLYDIVGAGEPVLAGTYLTGELPRQALYADLDGDAIADMVVPVRYANRVELRRGLGGMAFESDATLLTMSGQPMAGIFDDRNTAYQAHQGLKARGYRSFFCRPLEAAEFTIK